MVFGVFESTLFFFSSLPNLILLSIDGDEDDDDDDDDGSDDVLNRLCA